MNSIPKDIWEAAGPGFNDYPAMEQALNYKHVRESLLRQNSKTGLYPLEAAWNSHNTSIFDLILKNLETLKAQTAQGGA